MDGQMNYDHIPILSNRRYSKYPSKPLHSNRVFESRPVGNFKSWEFFTPYERSEILIQKLHIKFDLRPPGLRRHYQAVIGNCDWLTAWELALMCEHSLWAVHRRFDNEVNCLKSFGPDR